MKILFLLAAAAVAAASLVGSHSAATATKRAGGGDNTVESIITEELFEDFLKHRNSALCPGRNFYTYDAFVNASSAFLNFGSTGDLDTRKREIAAFFGQTSHETTGGWESALEPYAWGYCFVEAANTLNDFCVPSPQWPCVRGKRYYGRGPIQLSYNFNYGLAGDALGLDLLGDPDLVARDPVVSFQTSLWFWMTPQIHKPSCHDVIVGEWIPTQADLAAGRLPGFGVTTNIINGGLECGFGPRSSQIDRIGYYKRYCELLGVDPGDSLDCNTQAPFTSAGEIDRA